MGKVLDKYSQIYDRFLITGDFNAEDSEPCLSQFLFAHDAVNIVKENTCFKSLNNPSCIDLFITNSPLSFQNTVAISTGLSDFHKMVVTVMKMKFKKNKPREIFYRDYKNFNQGQFKEELSTRLEENIGDYDIFEKTFIELLDKYAPIKRKLLRANHAPYMTKTLRKAIMRRSQLETKYLKTKTKENLNLYKKQRNFCSKLYKKERKRYYDTLNTKDITDNKQFWKTIKPFLSDKNVNTSQITIEKNDKIFMDNFELSEEFSNFFENAVKALNIEPDEMYLNDVADLESPVDIAIKKFENHPSVKAIKENIIVHEEFEFCIEEVSNISKEILNLDSNKKGTFKNIPAKRLKENADICAPHLTDIWNEKVINQQQFPDKLKIADVTPVFKKEDKTALKN